MANEKCGIKRFALKKADGDLIEAQATDSGRLKTETILCGVQPDGTITPLLCDAAGRLVTIAGA